MRLHDVEKSLTELRNERQKKQAQLQASMEIEQRLQSIGQLGETFHDALKKPDARLPALRRAIIDALDIRVKIVRNDNRLLALMNILGTSIQVYIH